MKLEHEVNNLVWNDVADLIYSQVWDPLWATINSPIPTQTLIEIRGQLDNPIDAIIDELVRDVNRAELSRYIK